MPKPLYIICAKCGSDTVSFLITTPSKLERDNCGCGVYITCNDCGKLTGVEEYNEWVKSS